MMEKLIQTKRQRRRFGGSPRTISLGATLLNRGAAGFRFGSRACVRGWGHANSCSGRPCPLALHNPNVTLWERPFGTRSWNIHALMQQTGKRIHMCVIKQVHRQVHKPLKVHMHSYARTHKHVLRWGGEKAPRIGASWQLAIKNLLPPCHWSHLTQKQNKSSKAFSLPAFSLHFSRLRWKTPTSPSSQTQTHMRAHVRSADARHISTWRET